jgi:hypothetical protein
MKRTTVALLCPFLLCIASVCLAQDASYPTNLELIGQAVKQAAESMDISPPAGSGPMLEINAGKGSDASWLLENVLKEHLLALGWRIRANSEGADTTLKTSGYLLKLRVADLGIQYGRSWRRYLLGGKMVERIAKVALYYELVDLADGRVVVSSDVNGEASDVVPASKLAMLGSANYPFASPQLEKTQWDKYMEGGLVIAIIGVLVYLFYSNKTAS